MDVLEYARKACAAAIDKLALTAAEQPARFQAVGLGNAKFGPVKPVAVRAHGVFHRFAHPLHVFWIDAGIENVKAHLGVYRQTEQRLAAVVPDQQPFFRAKVPGTHAGCIDGNPGACLKVRQGFFGTAATLTFLHFGKRPAHCLGQQRQVFLQYVVGGTQADHFHRVLLTVYARQEDERRIRRQALGDGQHVGTGRAGQHAVAKDQVIAGFVQGMLGGDMIEHQLRLQLQSAALQA